MNKPILFPIICFCGLLFSCTTKQSSYEPIKGMDIGPRERYMNMVLADPKTGSIPHHSRANELVFAKRFLNTGSDITFKVANDNLWTFAGPNNVGGRTRALHLDIRDENTILAAGVSSGIFKSTDQGKSWRKTLRNDQLQSITSIIQDKRPGKENNWYAGTGEFHGNSSDLNGDGIYHSSDNGESWNLLSATQSKTPQIWDGSFEFIYKIVQDYSNLQQDEMYVATALGGILRSTDGGKSFRTVLGSLGNQSSLFSDITITPTGIVYATMSQIGGGGAISKVKGIWRSVDGVKWTNITPTGFPEQYYKIAIGVNPKDERQVYFFGYTPNSGKQSRNFRGDIEWNSLWKYHYVSGDGSASGGTWENRSMNLPTLGGHFGDLITQSGYDLVVEVHPYDTNTIFIGGTNLYRSRSGFLDTMNTEWIGGYKPGTMTPYFDTYPSQHPDQHGLLFLPSNPLKAISFNDGGIQMTDNCLDGKTVWKDRNTSYVTSQFYTIAIDHGEQHKKTIIGGLQDNGTYYTQGNDPLKPWTMPLTYDGAFCAIAQNASRYYMSAQLGRVVSMKLDETGTILERGRIDPVGGKDYLFINPFILDPEDERIMYLAGGSILWRNNDLSTIPMNRWDSTNVNWDSLPATRLPDGELITSVSASRNPAHTVYYGTNKGNLYVIEQAHQGNPTPKNITGSGFSNGTIQCIAIDPRDAKSIIAVFSNYNVISLFHSSNGGEQWTPIAGNLEDNQSGTGAGPSCRWAEILPIEQGFKVYVGTSIGLFSTGALQGNATCWQQEGQNSIGNAVITMMDYRISDGYMAISTHGAGVYVGSIHALPAKVASPTLVYPAQDTTSQSTLVRYQWQPANGTVFSRLEVSEFLNFSQLTFSRSMIPAGIYSGSTTLRTGRRYYWRVFGINSAGDSEPSAIRTMTIGNISSINEEETPLVNIVGNSLMVSHSEHSIAYSIIDISGRTVRQGILNFSPQSSISLDFLPRGIYMLTFPNKSNSKPYIFNSLGQY